MRDLAAGVGAKLGFFTVWMTPQTRWRIVDVTRPVLVFVIHSGLVVLVTIETSEDLIIVCLFMAGIAARPLVPVSSRKDREVI